MSGIEPEHFVERLERAIDEPAALEVEPEAEQHVRLLEPRQLRPLQQALMDVDGAGDLALLAIEAAEQQVNFERVAEGFGGLAQLLDGEIDLVGDEKVQAEDVVQRLGRAAAIDEAAGLQLVALPRLADGEPDRAGR